MNSGVKVRSVLANAGEVAAGGRAESKAPGLARDDLETLDWSDEESDYVMRVPAREEPEPFDVEKEVEQPAVANIETHSEDYRRSKIYSELRHGGDAVVHAPKVLLPREQRQPQYKSFRLPLPYTPQHVKESLGMDIIEHLWYEFLQHGADESELVQIHKLKSISKAMKKHMGYAIPLGEIHFPLLDDDDFVDFREVTLQMVLWADQRQELIQQHVVKGKKEVLGRCCALDSCTIKTFSSAMAERKHGEIDYEEEKNDNKQHAHIDEVKKGGGDDEDEDDDDDEDEDEGEHSLLVAYVRYKLEHKGTVRIKHICEIMDEVLIPYDKSRIPSSEWTIRGELLLTSPKELQSLCERIRTDKDYERNKAKDDIYALPRWMENEFSSSEIMLFKHQFRSIDVDGGGQMDADELVALTAQMGNQVTDEQAQGLIDLMDMDGSGTVDFSEFMMLLYKIQNGVIDLEGNMLAQAMVEAKTQLSIFEEIEELHRDPPPYGHVVNYGGNPVQCDIAITGPENTLYEGGTFRLRVILLNGYPFRLPDITFQTRVYHVNVLCEMDGLGYFPHIKYLWDSSWSLRRLVGHIVDLLREPRMDYIPVELVKIVKVFFYEEKEKRRIAEEQRLAELARLAEIARLEELARMEEEHLRIQREAIDEMVSHRERRAMAGEDLQNEVELADMEAEDANANLMSHDDEEDASMGTFTSEADDCKQTGAAADASSQSKADAKGEEGEESEGEDWGDAKSKRRRPAAAKSDAKLNLPNAVKSEMSISRDEAKSTGGYESMLEADSKDQAAVSSARRGSKASQAITPLHSARSRKSDNNNDDDDDDDDDDGDDREVKGKTKSSAPVEETFIGMSSQEMLKPLMRVQQMHLTVIQFFLGERFRYEDVVRDFVKKFAWTTQPQKKEKEPDPEEDLDEDACTALLRYQAEGFSIAEMCLAIKAELGVNTTQAAIGVWFHDRLQVPPEPGGDLGEIDDHKEAGEDGDDDGEEEKKNTASEEDEF